MNGRAVRLTRAQLEAVRLDPQRALAALSSSRPQTSDLRPQMTDSRPVAVVTNTVSPYRREPFRLLAERQGAEVIAWEGAGPPVTGWPCTGRRRRGPPGWRVRALPGGGLRSRRAGRAAGHLRGRAARRHSVRAVGDDLVPSADPGARALVAGHPPPVPARRRRGHLREPREPLRGAVSRRPATCSWRPRPWTWSISARPCPRPSATPRASAPAGRAPGCWCSSWAGWSARRAWRCCWRRGGGPTWAPAPGWRWRAGGPLAGAVAGAGTGIRGLGYVPASDLPSLYAAADVLVVPSVRTATFVEPWGLVVNEAMLQSTPVIASDAVGAVAGGLVRDGHNGLVVPGRRRRGPGRAPAKPWPAAPELRARMGAAARPTPPP